MDPRWFGRFLITFILLFIVSMLVFWTFIASFGTDMDRWFVYVYFGLLVPLSLFITRPSKH